MTNIPLKFMMMMTKWVTNFALVPDRGYTNIFALLHVKLKANDNNNDDDDDNNNNDSNSSNNKN